MENLVGFLNIYLHLYIYRVLLGHCDHGDCLRKDQMLFPNWPSKFLKLLANF